jgi:Pectate lyase superfamily protein
MSKQVINVGLGPNDGTGDPLRSAFQKSNSNFTELYNSLGIPGPPGPIGPPGNSGAIVDWVSVRDHGAVGNGVADDTAAIQAAIDAAVAGGGISTIYMPKGTYKISTSLYLDPPSNMRANAGVGVFGAFSLALLGDEGWGHEGYGTKITPTFNSAPAIIVGCGQGMVLRNLTIVGPAGTLRTQQPGNVPGVAYTGFGIASRTRTDNVIVENFYVGFMTGYGGDGLNDSNTWVKCQTFNTGIGWYISQSQNFINSLYDCSPQATTGILCSNGGGAHIYGGNWSVFDSAAGWYPMSAVSALVVSGDTYRFTATLTGPPDSFFNSFSVWTINTVHYGPIPLLLVAFNTGTNQATFEILTVWRLQHYGNLNIPATTDMQAEIQAQVQVFGAELITTFRGTNITAKGIHIENDNAVCRLIHSEVTFGDNRPNVLSQIFYNTDSGNHGLRPSTSPSTTALGRYLAAKVHPFIKVEHCDTYISDSQLGLRDYVPVELSTNLEFVVERMSQNFLINPWTPAGSVTRPDGPGAGRYDRLYFVERDVASDPMDIGAYSGLQQSPFWNYRPAGYTTPAIDPAYLATLSGVLPPLTAGGGADYPMLWGNHVYKFNKFETGAVANHHISSNHHWYSYGQDLTNVNIPSISWSYKGQSHCVFMDANTMKRMRHGLGIKLFDGVSDVLYIVTGVYPDSGVTGVPPDSGFVTVSSNFRFPTLASGNKVTIFAGTLIKQEPYVITTY